MEQRGNLRAVTIVVCLIGLRSLVEAKSTAKSCIGPESRHLSMMQRLLIQKEFCVHTTYKNAQWPPTVDVTATFDGKEFAEETLNQQVEHIEEKCYEISGHGQGCKVCLGFEDIEIADDWATVCPKAIIECPGVSNAVIPMPCNEMGDEDMDDVEEITYGLTSFGFDLLSSTTLTQGMDTLSAPFSVANTLMVTMLACAGSSRDQIHDALHLGKNLNHRAVAESYGALLGGLQHEDQDVTSFIDSTLWFGSDYWDKVNPEFKEKSKEFVDVKRLDFSGGSEQATQAINDHISQASRGHITKGVAANVGPHTVMLFTNTVYLAASFEFKFTHTNWESYHDPNIKHGGWKNTRVDMMYTEEEEFMVAWTDNSEVIEIPFKGEFSDFVMYMIRPRTYTEADTIKVEKDLAENGLFDILERLKPTKMKLSFPIFEMFYTEDLTTQLQALGIKDVMDPRKSNMKPLFKNDTHLNAYDDAFNRQGWLKVSPDGIQAAAFSGDGFGHEKDSSGKIAHADKPFIFLVMDRGTNVMMFAGRVTNPNGWYLDENHTHSHSHAALIVFLVLLLATVVYCGIMYTFNLRNGMSGSEAIPHRDCMVSCALGSVSAVNQAYDACTGLCFGGGRESGVDAGLVNEGNYAPMEDSEHAEPLL